MNVRTESIDECVDLCTALIVIELDQVDFCGQTRITNELIETCIEPHQ